MKEEYFKTIDELYSELNSSYTGLSNEEAAERLNKNGKNLLISNKKESKILKFFKQFNDLMIIILLIAAAFSFALSLVNNESFADSIIIVAIVILNAIMSFLQEVKADKSIEALNKMATPQVKVKRNDIIKKINIEDIVIGDILVLESGDYIPADARIITYSHLKCDESSLTGESLPVDKDNNNISDNTPLSERTNIIYAGCTVSYGNATAIVVKTGMNTELGKIAKDLLQTKKIETPLQIKIEQISKFLTAIIILIIIVMFGIGLVRGMEILEVIMLAIALAVAAIPEGLPTVITIVLSLGISQMAKKNAIIRKISSIETLGTTNIICSDKTGTITQNQMTVKAIYLNNNLYEKLDKKIKNSDLLNYVFALCNDVSENEEGFLGDPTEIALVKYLKEMGYKPNKIIENCPRINDIPFDSERKLMSTLNMINNKKIVLAKGSLESVLKNCSSYIVDDVTLELNDNVINEIKEKEKYLSDKALRVIAFAYKINDDNDISEDNLSFVGLVGMIDPPRENVDYAIAMCKKAHIKPIMITGDNLNTAKAIAKEIGIISNEDEAVLGEELDKYSDEELKEVVKKYSVYARVTPNHKQRIVTAWQENKKVVAMTGDGVNDAPAIKMAHIGIGMGINGTEVTKNVSDMVLADDCFNTIVTAVEEGRRIYDNIRNVIVYLLTGNITEIIIVFIGMLFGFEIFLPIQLLYINFITDSIPAIALSFEKATDNIMENNSRDINSPFFTKFILGRIFTSTVFKSLAILISFAYGYAYFNLNVACTMAFLCLGLSEIFFSFSCKNLKKSLLNKNLFNNKVLNLSILILIVAQALILFTPLRNIFKLELLNATQIFITTIIAITVLLLNELSKSLIKKIFKDN